MTATTMTTAQTDKIKIIMDKLAILRPNVRDVAIMAVNSYVDGIITQEHISTQPTTATQ